LGPCCFFYRKYFGWPLSPSKALGLRLTLPPSLGSLFFQFIIMLRGALAYPFPARRTNCFLGFAPGTFLPFPPHLPPNTRDPVPGSTRTGDRFSGQKLSFPLFLEKRFLAAGSWFWFGVAAVGFVFFLRFRSLFADWSGGAMVPLPSSSYIVAHRVPLMHKALCVLWVPLSEQIPVPL